MLIMGYSREFSALLLYYWLLLLCDNANMFLFKKEIRNIYICEGNVCYCAEKNTER